MDLAAATASPGLLAVRDRLLVCLAFASGIYEAVCFISFGKVFTAFQTGNIVFLGLGIAGVRPPDGPDQVRVLISLAAFAIGAMVAVRILKAFDGDEELEDDEVFQVWPRRVSAALGVALVAQVAFLALWVAFPLSSDVENILVALSAFALGMQMNAIRSLHVPGISTTAATATFITLATGAATWSHKAPAARRLTGVVVALILGAFVGTWLLKHAHPYAAVLPVIVIGIVIVIAAVSLKEDHAQRR
ncbi:YoaK family protein [Pseudonocardia xinjiangensis]|uniref:YoaK family protein n=1 Tax=Pseudonocardia xinjiangensis TaxID=75289 RepID=UPI003D8A1998